MNTTGDHTPRNPSLRRNSQVLDFLSRKARTPARDTTAAPGAKLDMPATLSTHHPVRGLPALDLLEQNWWALASAGSLPRRADVNAQTIGAALPYSFIASRIAPGHARLRVAGRRISGLVGVEARGMPLSCILTAEARPILADRMERAFSTPAIVDIPVYSPRSIARPALSGRLLLLPLSGADGGFGPVRTLLGALLIDGAYGARPRRLYIDPDARWRCDETTGPIARPRLQAHSGGNPAAVKRSAHPRPTLKLVVNNAS